MTTSETPPDTTPDAATVTGSGNASADRAGLANTGVIIGDVTSEYHEHHHHPRAVPVWPALVGQPPPLASAFQPRRGLREQILAARRRGDDIVLTQPEDGAGSAAAGTQVLAGGGGVGKSQLAAWFAHDAVEHGTDLLVWVPASSPDQVITTYARAAVRVGVPGADGTDPVADAGALLEWLHITDRTWLVVLDDITDPAHLTRWWPPHRSTGWTVATTRLQDATLTSSGRQKFDVDVYTEGESLAYLTDRLTNAQLAHLLDGSAGDLAAALGHLPLALSHATAYMINQEESCAAYLARYTRREQLAELMPADADPDAYGRPVTVTLLLALDAADTTTPAGLARPALALAALLDPNGHPDTLWTTTAVTDYLTTHRTHNTGQPVTPDQARKALRLLHRYSLLTHTPTNGPRAVRIHALTARATRETTTTNTATLAHAAADALLHLWPANDHTTPDLTATLRTNTTTLADIAGDLLWHPHGHPLLYQSGNSLLRAGLPTPATTYWHHMTEQAARLLGDEHPDTLTARANLAASYWQAGRTADAITIEEKVVADRERLLGDDHPDTLTARANLAASYWQAGRTADAITIEEKVLADRERLLGDDHPDTLTARANLASSYHQAGRTTDAITIKEKVVADSARLLGDDHPDTLTVRGNLAASYRQAGRTTEAITIGEKVLADRERRLGDEHPHTLTARANLAASYRQAGRTTDAINLLKTVVADRERLLGDEHPETVAAARALRAWQADP
ncbi:hypothetical protein M2302_003289 [Micromonospora sp. A200]|uniref:tetratricopeptide repeat protein n=1 Tax=Micromonospora sp. A200 TaxID=2940568 RepID=UPI002473428E|nr:tetratricopeptide repeat protein [Micromonospora sp. A200]MDH6463104.1 hypothetical protein [Micromonospora sp. A200]